MGKIMMPQRYRNNRIDWSKITWSSGTDELIIKMVATADAGEINLADYWNVGDERTINLPAMTATNVGETHAAQTVTLVLLNVGGKTLVSGNTCNFIVGLKDCLNETGFMNSTSTNSGSWESSARRKWCNNEFKTAMLSTGIGTIFKQHYNITAKEYYSSTNQTSIDWFALPSGKEMFGTGYIASSGSISSGGGYSNNYEAQALAQFSYYTDNSRRIKKVNGSGMWWWERSPYFNYASGFCAVSYDGSASEGSANRNYGIAPFGCI